MFQYHGPLARSSTLALSFPSILFARLPDIMRHVSEMTFTEARLINATLTTPTDGRPSFGPESYPLLCRITNRAFVAFLAPLTRRARVAWTIEPACRDAILGAGKPILYFGWHRWAWIGSMALSKLEVLPRPTVIGHTGARSRATHFWIGWLGLDGMVFRKSLPWSPRDQIAEFVRRTGRDIFLLPDSGGPYGSLKPGFLGIAKAAGALLAPMAFRAQRAAIFGSRMQHVVPGWGDHITGSVGAPFSPDTTPERCEAALADLERSLDPDRVSRVT